MHIDSKIFNTKTYDKVICIDGVVVGCDEKQFIKIKNFYL